ncbi:MULTISPECIES: 4Fe-4S cluster-binding domain-containing protein [unclassified Adlercreutzia]|uniref:4Fe-4S cluster-binding domain-containing protein n=1 Tax=unclassified Adlercreutzia TaxID=2636013 RepID=UPI0013EDF4DF|nr:MULTISPECIES: 4Fe-4S cluster-binding domain-containing protein [unclassified Adlercreutzia]
MLIEINRICSPVTTLGPGRRLGLWLQGCDIRCPSCVSKDTWETGAGQIVETIELAELIMSMIQRDNLCGITITGGEPTQQSRALADLVRRVRQMGKKQIDLIMFTGRTEQEAKLICPQLISLMDACVFGPYIAEQSCSGSLIASENQQLVFMRACSAAFKEALINASNQLQVNVAGATITFSGIPRNEDMIAIEKILEKKGVQIGETSWSN